jgi:ubiquitin-protein ligase
MNDKVYEAFLKRQYEEGMALAASSDLLELYPIYGDPPQVYEAHFKCNGLVRGEDGGVNEADSFGVRIWFPSDYLRLADPFEVLAWLGPQRVFHPNISDKAPLICVGRLAPGTSLVDILYQCFEIITYNKVTMREDDCLNREACSWARENQHRFPVDRRPLRWQASTRQLDLKVELIEQVQQ